MLKKSLILVTLLAPLWAQADVITVRGDTWCPYNCKPNSSKPSFMIEILQQTLGKNGHTIDYQEMNWARAVIEARAGKFHAVVGAAKYDAPDFIFPDNALGKNSACFYTLSKTQWKYTGLESLQTVTIGVIRDYAYDDGEFDNYVKKNQNNRQRLDVISGDDVLKRNLDKLRSGRITALVESEPVIAFHQSNSKSPVKLKNAGCFKETPVYVAFSPSHPQSKEYAKLLSDGVQEMRKSGQLKKILDKYGLKDNF
jgi:polar amino acid transport system substrate-binding protein